MDSIDNLLHRLEQLVEIGRALSSERNIDRLLETIVAAAQQITRAEGGTLYRVSPDGQSLRFEIARNTRLGLASGGTSGVEASFPPLPLRLPNGEANVRAVAAYAATQRQTVNIADAYAADGFDFSGPREYDARIGYRSQSFLTVPMTNHENEVVGVLQLINAIAPDSGEIVPFSSADQRLAESLASQAAIALTNRQLIDQLGALFESFIELINVAIDEKSPYTGGHCARVPELTMMLADAVMADKEGPLSGFAMSDAQRRELRIAALLHDCGKITTPVHVVDKATKLQAIYDRIGLVDTRFEVAKRDAEIAMLRAILALRTSQDAAAEETLDNAYRARLASLDADRDFLRVANIGEERMSAETQERVRAIATETSWRAPDGSLAPLLDAEEVENLCIASGTLTERERAVINHHVVATIRMLEALPWPRDLRNVSQFAGSHHERLDGKGYPRGLSSSQMPLQARLLCIADVFEALTAADRPYKRGKTLSESINILGKMAQTGHIDPDLFRVFVHRRVYLDYATKFLDPAQIDAVDEAAIPGLKP